MIGLGFYDREAVEARREEMRSTRRSRSIDSTPITASAAAPPPARAVQPARGTALTPEQLQRTHPDLYAAVLAAGHEEGATEERQRQLVKAARIGRERRQSRAAGSFATRFILGGPLWGGEEALTGADPATVRRARELVDSLPK